MQYLHNYIFCWHRASSFTYIVCRICSHICDFDINSCRLGTWKRMQDDQVSSWCYKSIVAWEMSIIIENIMCFQMMSWKVDVSVVHRLLEIRNTTIPWCALINVMLIGYAKLFLEITRANKIYHNWNQCRRLIKIH